MEAFQISLDDTNGEHQHDFQIVPTQNTNQTNDCAEISKLMGHELKK